MCATAEDQASRVVGLSCSHLFACRGGISTGHFSIVQRASTPFAMDSYGMLQSAMHRLTPLGTANYVPFCRAVSASAGCCQCIQARSSWHPGSWFHWCVWGRKATQWGCPWGRGNPGGAAVPLEGHDCGSHSSCAKWEGAMQMKRFLDHSMEQVQLCQVCKAADAVT